MIDASLRMVAAAHLLLFFSKKTHISFLGLSPIDRGNSANANLIALFELAIEARQRNGDNRQDILALFCQAKYEDGQTISREHIYSELMTFLFAGHETTALSMAWAIYHLHRNPASLTRLREELDALPDEQPETLAAAPYLKAVVQETLRIHPIVTETLRKLTQAMDLGEFTVPAGMAVASATVLAHYNADVYPEPDTFRPERFLERSYLPFEYMRYV